MNLSSILQAWWQCRAARRAAKSFPASDFRSSPPPFITVTRNPPADPAPESEHLRRVESRIDALEQTIRDLKEFVDIFSVARKEKDKEFDDIKKKY